MSPGLQLSDAGHRLYEAWRDHPATTDEEAALVLAVLSAIATGGWPPQNTDHGLPAPRWPYMRDSGDPRQWIVAPSDDLWVVVRPGAQSFDFVTATRPVKDQLVEWLTDPELPAGE